MTTSVDVPRARPTAELPVSLARPPSRGLQAIDGRQSTSAATEARRPSTLSEELLFRAYGMGPRLRGVEP